MSTKWTPATAAEKHSETVIKSDGTIKGTTITVNGQELSKETLSNFSFSLWNDRYDKNVHIHFTVNDPDAGKGDLSKVSHYTLVCASVNDVVTGHITPCAASQVSADQKTAAERRAMFSLIGIR